MPLTINERAVIFFVDTLDELSLHDVVRGLVAVKFCHVDFEMGCLCLDLRSRVVFHVGKIAWIGWFNEGDTSAGGVGDLTQDDVRMTQCAVATVGRYLFGVAVEFAKQSSVECMCGR